MLDVMRKHARNWMMKVLLGIIIVVFIFYFGSLGGPQKAETVVTVDGKAVSYVDLQREYERLVDFHRARYGAALTDEVLKGLNLKQQALDSLVKQVIVLQKARNLRLQVTDDEVRAAILATPAFQANGVFNDRLYRSMLRHNRITPEEFEETQRRVLTMARLEYLIQDGVKVPADEVDEACRLQGEKLFLQYVVFAAKDYQNRISPTAEQLETYLKGHPEEFRVPEQVQLRVLAFLGTDYAAGVTVAEAEAREAYERNKGKYSKEGKPLPYAAVRDAIAVELRQIEGMRRAQRAAKEAHDTIYQEENFDAHAAAKGLKVVTTGLSPLDKAPPVLEGVPDLPRILSGLQKDRMSRVLSGPEGYFVVKVLARKPAFVPPLVDIEGEVRKRFADWEAKNLAAQEAEAFLERLRKGDAFAKAVAEKSLRIQDAGPVSPAAPPPVLGDAPETREALYLLSEARPYPDKPFPVAGGSIVVRFKDQALDEQQLAADRPRIQEFLLATKRSNAVQSWIEGVKARLEKEGRLTYHKEAETL